MSAAPSQVHGRSQFDHIVDALRMMVRRPDLNFEVRSPQKDGGVLAQIFRGGQFEAAAKAAISFNKEATGVYVTLNPIKIEKTSGSASAANIERRIWLLIDADPIRPGVISSTEAEKASAFDLAHDICQYLTNRGWPEPAKIDSGNGGHLLYAIDLPVDDGGLVKSVLEALAGKFNNEACEVDVTVADAPRISKLPGTQTRKGEASPDRPHRFSRLLSVPDELKIVDESQLRQLVADLTPQPVLSLEDAIERKRAQSGPVPPPKQSPNAGFEDMVASSGSWTPEARAIAYVEKCEPSISGSRGHNQAFKTACKIGPGFNLAPEVAYQILRDHFNNRCEPPWSEKELRHKVDQSYAKETRRGFLLDADRNPSRNGNGRLRINRGGDGSGQPDSTFFNFETTWSGEGEEKKASYHPLRMDELERSLKNLTHGWPKRVGEVLFRQSANCQPVYLDSSTRLVSWVDSLAQVDWKQGGRFISQERFYEHLRMNAEQYDAIETLPHFPKLPGIYYMHQAVPKGTGKLDGLLDFFCPATPVDRELIKAFILTLFWGGQPGSRPGFLITGPDQDGEQGGRGVGKTQLPSIISEELTEGFIDVSPTDAIPDVKVRLLSDEGRGARIARLDNVKTLRLSWADLEGMITTSTISGRMLYRGEGRRPNTIVWVITLNGASLSKDMAQRVIMIKLARPVFDGSWENRVRGYIRSHRWEIIAEIGEILARDDGQPEMAGTRWASWEREVLWHVSAPESCRQVIVTRQQDVDDDNEERDLVANYFDDQLQRRGHDPLKDAVFIPSLEAAQWLSQATGTNYPTNRASTFIRGLGVGQLTYSPTNTARGWVWRGLESDIESKPKKLNPAVWEMVKK